MTHDESAEGAAPPATQSLMDAIDGQWCLTTKSGSRYYVDLDLMLFSRIPVSPEQNSLAGPLRRDAEPVAILEILDGTVGRRGLLKIDLRVPGVAWTLRQTTPIVSIERIEGENSMHMAGSES